MQKAKAGISRSQCRVVIRFNKGDCTWVLSDGSSDVTLVHGKVKIIALHAQQLAMAGRRKPYHRGYCTVLYQARANCAELVFMDFEI